MPVIIEIDITEVNKGLFNLARAKLWAPLIIHGVMRDLGKETNQAMRRELRPHRYSGILEDSVSDSYNQESKTLSIGPTARRGGYNAGDIFELGTRPIRGVPWTPIRLWGLRRGMSLKRIYFAWVKIREEGVSAHPFVENVIRRSDFQAALQKASDRIGQKMAAKVFAGDEQISGFETR